MGGYFLNKQEKGFTLIEVSAALLIISFILLGILSLMQSTKKLSAENVDQLVMTSFATGSLKRFLDHPELYIPTDAIIDSSCNKVKKINCYFDTLKFPSSLDVNHPSISKDLYHLQANDQNYFLKITLTQDVSEKNKELINVVLFVSKDQNFNKGRVKVEGYLSYAENKEAPKN